MTMSGGAGKSVGDEATRVQPSNLFPDEDKDEVVQYLRSPGRRLPVLTIEQRGLQEEGRAIALSDDKNWAPNDEPPTKTYRFENRRVGDEVVFNEIALQSRVLEEHKSMQLWSLRGLVAGEGTIRVLDRVSLSDRGITLPKNQSTSMHSSQSDVHADNDNGAVVQFPITPRKDWHSESQRVTYTSFERVGRRVPAQEEFCITPPPASVPRPSCSTSSPAPAVGVDRYPISRAEYKAIDRERIPTPQRQQSHSVASRQPRSDSPLAVYDKASSAKKYSSIMPFTMTKEVDVGQVDQGRLEERRDMEFDIIGQETLSMDEFKANFRHTMTELGVTKDKRRSEVGRDATTSNQRTTWAEPTKVFQRVQVSEHLHASHLPTSRMATRAADEVRADACTTVGVHYTRSAQRDEFTYC